MSCNSNKSFQDRRRKLTGGKTRLPIFIGIIATFLIPVIASAQLQPIIDLVGAMKRILGSLIPLAFGLAVLFFFYGIALYIYSAGDIKKAQDGKSIMIYGVIAIAVMASIWGLVLFLQTTFIPGQAGSNNSVQVPQIQGVPYQ